MPHFALLMKAPEERHLPLRMLMVDTKMDSNRVLAPINQTKNRNWERKGKNHIQRNNEND